MINFHLTKLFSCLLGSALCLLPLTFTQAAAKPVQLTVLSAGAFMGAFQALSADYEKRTGVRLVAELAPSMGNAPHSITNRLSRNEPADVLLMTGQGLDRLIKDGQADGKSRVDLGKAYIAMAVREGAPRPDIGTMDAFRQTLLDASSIAYSNSTSGLYLSRVLFNQMHIAERLQDKSQMVVHESVGDVLARGEAQIGFQQLSELKPVSGIQIIGLIPDQAQQMTLYSGAISTGSAHPEDARALLQYLGSSEAVAAIKASGLEPVAR